METAGHRCIFTKYNRYIVQLHLRHFKMRAKFNLFRKNNQPLTEGVINVFVIIIDFSK